MKDIDCVYVSELIKDKARKNNDDDVFKSQFYFTGKQAFEISKCFGKVDVIITDSPIALAAQYTELEKLADIILEEFNKYEPNNYNILLRRTNGCNTNGIHQTENEAKKIDYDTEQWLNANNISYITADGNLNGYQKILDNIILILNK